MVFHLYVLFVWAIDQPSIPVGQLRYDFSCSNCRVIQKLSCEIRNLPCDLESVVRFGNYRAIQEKTRTYTSTTAVQRVTEFSWHVSVQQWL